MKCKLCTKDKKLIKAHIFPDFLYKNLGLYFPDQKGQGRVHKAKFSDRHFHYNKKGLPDELYDPSILCQECDNYFNEEFENYAKTILFDNINGSKVKFTDTGIELRTFINIDYVKFKLFMLSIFWRASISSKFEGIKLSSNDEEELRLMFVNKEAKEEDFGVVLFHMNDPELTSRLLTDIKTIITEKKTCYAFIAGGLVFYLYPNKILLPNNHKELLLTMNGTLKILQYPIGSSKKILNEFYDKQLFN